MKVFLLIIPVVIFSFCGRNTNEAIINSKSSVVESDTVFDKNGELVSSTTVLKNDTVILRTYSFNKVACQCSLVNKVNYGDFVCYDSLGVEYFREKNE